MENIIKTLILFLIVLILGIIIIRVTDFLFNKFKRKISMPEIAYNHLNRLIIAIMYSILIVILLSIVGVSAGVFFAVLSAMGVAIGFAFRDILSNFLSGYIIILSKNLFEVGDFVSIVNKCPLSRVQEVRLYYSILETMDKKEIVVPNNFFTREIVINHSKNGVFTFSLEVFLESDNDVTKVKELTKDAILAMDLIDENSNVRVVFSDLFLMKINIETSWEKGFELQSSILELLTITYAENDVKIRYVERI